MAAAWGVRRAEVGGEVGKVLAGPPLPRGLLWKVTTGREKIRLLRLYISIVLGPPHTLPHLADPL